MKANTAKDLFLKFFAIVLCPVMAFVIAKLSMTVPTEIANPAETNTTACKVSWNIDYRKPTIGGSTSGSFARPSALEAIGPDLEYHGVSRLEFYSTTIHDMDAEWIPFIRFYEEKPATSNEVHDGTFGKYSPPAPPAPSAPSEPTKPLSPPR